MPSVDAASTFGDGVFDFVFVDADHTYPAVWQDLHAWYPKLKPGGILAGHDYGHPRDRRGLWGVKRAVDAFAEEQTFEVYVGSGTVWWTRKPG